MNGGGVGAGAVVMVEVEGSDLLVVWVEFEVMVGGRVVASLIE